MPNRTKQTFRGTKRAWAKKEIMVLFLAFWDGISRMKRLNRASNKENIMVDRQVKV